MKETDEKDERETEQEQVCLCVCVCVCVPANAGLYGFTVVNLFKSSQKSSRFMDIKHL